MSAGTIPMVCSNCGSERVEINHARPSVDDRYASGWCLTEAKKPVERHLVRGDMFARVKTERDRQQAIAERAKDARGYADPKFKRSAAGRQRGAKVVEELHR